MSLVDKYYEEVLMSEQQGIRAYIILSAGGGLLESKPILCGGYYPPQYLVPLYPGFDITQPRFHESPGFIDEKPIPIPVWVFRPTDQHRLIKPGIMARIYELEKTT